jgi:gamma-glutamyltranspeptidase/glutathione hydrolase
MMPQGSSFTTRPQLAGTFGMVASTHWLATGAGMAVLEAGGTAFDAAAAAGLVLQVVEPHMNGIGGEVPVIGYAAPDGGTGPGGVFVLDGQGPAPGTATLEAFSDLGLDLVPGNGLLAACVPAAFGTWLLLVQRHGRLPLREVMKYAIGYARDGYPVTAGVSAGIAAAGPLFREYWPTSAEVYLGGGVPAAGSRFANPALAATYQRILDEAEAVGPGREQQIEAARRAFYEGFVAEAIGAYLARAEVMDLTGQRNRGLLSPADLAAWRARPEAPVTLDFMGLTVCKTGPWGQGPVFLQQLALLDAAGVAGLAPGSADFMHTVVECAKLAFADRFGNMVSATPSGGWLQSSPVIPGLGFCLGTRAQMFTLTPGLPNTLAPGKRPRTTLTPSLALRGGQPYLAFGTPGGDQQDQWTLAFFVNHVAFGMNLQEAIDAPAFHTRHFPSSFYPRESAPLAMDVEERAGPEVLAALRARGHQVTVRPPWSLGRVSAVARDGGMLYAAANPRGMQGYAAGR